MKKWMLYMFAAASLLVMVGCQVGIDRNDDGSLRLEAEMPEAALEAEIQAAIADPLVEEVTVDLRSGYLEAEATRRRLNGSGLDSMSFRLDLGVENGHMTALISEVVVDGFSVSQERVDLWNQRIAANLERAGSRSDNSQLTAVTVGPEAVTLVWRIETPRSRGEQ